MGEFLAKSYQFDKLAAVCVVCADRRATRTQRIIVEKNEVEEEVRRPADYNDPIILVGASDHYEARCRRCHDVPESPVPDYLDKIMPLKYD